MTDSLDTADSNKENDEEIDVYFEILTNWGNSKYLGLTEVCTMIVIKSVLHYTVRGTSAS